MPLIKAYKLTVMNSVFQESNNFSNLELNFDALKIIDMEYTFNLCHELGINIFNTSKN